MSLQHDTGTRRRHGGRTARAAHPAAALRGARRVSGPAAGAHPGAAAVTLPPTAAPAPRRPVPVSAPRQGTGVFARIAAERLLDRMLRGRAWICVVAAALGGIVFMQVWLLKLNTGISRAVQTTATLERQNAELEAGIARLSAGDRIRRLAGGRGMSDPPAGAVAYVTARGAYDAGKAVGRMTAPSAEARQLLAEARAGTGAFAPVPTAAGSVAADGTALAGTTGATGVATDPTTTPTTTTPATTTATDATATADPTTVAPATTTAPVTTPAPGETAMAPGTSAGG